MDEKMLQVFVLCLMAVCCLPLGHGVRPSSVVPKTFQAKRKRTIDCLDSRIANITCGDGFCVCNKTLELASCVGALMPRPLHYIPKLPPYTKYLCFDFNNLTSIGHANFFQNVSHLSTLILDNNNLVSVHPEAFSLLKNLTHLSLRHNPAISPASLSGVLTNAATLRHLEMDNCDLGRMTPDIFQNTTLPRLRSLSLRENQIETLNISLFRPLTQLRRLDLFGNRLLHVHVSCELYFRHLVLSTNNLYDFPRTCGKTNQSLLSALRTLLLDDNFISTLPSEICLPQLRTLDLSGNRMLQLPTGLFDGVRFPFLTRVDFSSMDDLLFVSESTFVNLTSLTSVGLSGNDLRVSVNDLINYFVNCPRVDQLDLSDNHFETGATDVHARRNDNLNVTSLRVASCDISKILPGTFCCFAHLSDLDLSDNLIYSLPDGVFDCLHHLTHVDLSNNKILVVSSDTFSAVIRTQLVHLDLSENLFQCDCDLLWFQAWMRRSPSLFRLYPYMDYDYNCKNTPNTTVPTFVLNEQACLMSHGTYVTMVSVMSLLIILLTMTVAACRYHWHLRLLCYEMCRGPSQVRRQRLQQGRFDFDVFVSYDSEDLAWVRQHLVPELEGRRGLRLCLHERDFPAGYIIDNIVRCVEGSKKIVMLFSDHFVKSRWCQFELSFCLRHVMDYEDALIVVCLDEVASRDMTSGMMAVLKTTTYLQWKDGDGADTAFFWQRLAVALQEILPAPQVV